MICASSVRKKEEKEIKIRRKMKAESADPDSVDEADLEIVLWFDSFVFVVIHLDAGRKTDLNVLSSSSSSSSSGSNSEFAFVFCFCCGPKELDRLLAD